MSPELQIFRDALMELGLVPFTDEALQIGFEGRRSSSVTVHIGQHGDTWIRWWDGRSGKLPEYVYMLPQHWVGAINRVKELIALAEQSAATGAMLQPPAGQGELIDELKRAGKR